MPGIFGVVERPGGNEALCPGALVRVVELMAAAMKYEPWYARDIFWCPELGACAGRVGWRSGSDAGAVRRVKAVVALVTSGEVLGLDSTSEGWADGGEVDTSGVGALGMTQTYTRAGERALEQVSGVAGFLMDRRRRTCLLFNDRYGAERLFLYREGTRTFFSSEAKAILAVAPHTRMFDAEGLAQFLACGCTLGVQSLFRGVEVLEGGTLVSFPVGEAVEQRTYFDRPSLEGLDPVPEKDFVGGLRERLKAAVTDAVRRPPKAAISLTGGLDSRMIMACLDARPGSVPCYTFGSMYRETLDVSIGREVAARCRQPHHVIPLGVEFLGNIRKTLAEAIFISDGYLGLSGAAELYLNRRARSIAPVRVTGNWGGELLRGVRAFKHAMPGGQFLAPDLMERLERSGTRFARAAEVSGPSFTLWHQMPHQGYGRYAIERSQMVMRTPFLDPRLIRWLYRAPASRNGSGWSSAIVEQQCPDLLEVATDQGHLGNGGAARLVQRLYRQVLVRGEYWTGHGAPDWLAGVLRLPLGGSLERLFRGRNKFQHFRPWLRREWAAFVRETLLEDGRGELQRWFDMRNVERMIDAHVQGRANYTDEIDKLLTVAITARDLLRKEVVS